MSYNYGQNNLRFDVRNSLNNSMGLETPTRFYAGTLEVTQNVLNADFSKPLDVGPGVSAGAGLRPGMARREVQRITR